MIATALDYLIGDLHREIDAVNVRITDFHDAECMPDVVLQTLLAQRSDLEQQLALIETWEAEA